MSADEFVSWRAFERIEPFGFPVIDAIQARILMLLDWQLHKENKDDYFTEQDLRFKPPEPLFVARAKELAARRRENRAARAAKKKESG